MEVVRGWIKKICSELTSKQMRIFDFRRYPVWKSSFGFSLEMQTDYKN